MDRMMEQFKKVHDKALSSGGKCQILITVNRVEMKNMLSFSIDGKFYKSFKNDFGDQCQEVLWRIVNGKRN